MHRSRVFGRGLAFALLVGGCAEAPAPPPTDLRAAIVARGDSLALPGEWEAPPGDPLSLSIGGFAKTLCSAVFLTGLEPEDAAANVGFFSGPLEDRGNVVDTVVDRRTETVRLKINNGVTRVAHRYASQGCVTLPIGNDSVYFTPTVVEPKLPPAGSTPWPMGDLIPPEPWPAQIDSAKLATALDTGFGPPEAMTLGLVVTYQGRILGERYAPGIGIHTPLESWSMGKSLTGTLMAVLIQQGVYRLDQPAPVPEWQAPGDPRQAIRITDLMRMSSGLRIRAPQDPDFDPSLGYADHIYFYTGENAFEWAATRRLQWPPNTVGRYRNVNPALVNYLIRLAVEKRGDDYHAFPQRSLFDKIGVRNAVLEVDPHGNFLTQGYELLPPRDWARIANLYLQDGVWNGERILPEGYVDYVRTLAPAWVADRNPVYGGGFFWVNGDGADPIPKTAYSMQGAGGQSATIIPTHGLVVVRLGKYRGGAAGAEALSRMFEQLLAAVPPLDRQAGS